MFTKKLAEIIDQHKFVTVMRKTSTLLYICRQVLELNVQVAKESTEKFTHGIRCSILLYLLGVRYRKMHDGQLYKSHCEITDL